MFYDCNFQLGRYGLQMQANDSTIQDCYIYGYTGGVASTGANYYIRCKLDTPPAFTSTYAFNHSANTAALLENHLTDCDLSGTYTYAVLIDDGANASTIPTFVGCVFSSPILLLLSRQQCSTPVKSATRLSPLPQEW